MRRKSLSAGRWIVVATVWVSAAKAGFPAEPELAAWTLSSWTRALRSDAPGTRRAVELFAARGEWESFQVCVRSSAPVRIVDLEVPPPAREGARLPGDSIGRYRAHQLFLARPTYRNDSFRPDAYPDPLIPFPDLIEAARAEAGETSGAGSAGAGPAPRFRAVPFDLPAGETHSFWVDVRVPTDAAPGTYRTAAAVVAEGGRRVELSIELHVWPFALPPVATLKTELGSPAPRILGWYRDEAAKGRLAGVPDAGAIHRECARLATDHRLNAYPPPELVAVKPGPDGGFEATSEQVAGWKDFLSRYHVNAVAVPPPSRYFKDPVAERERIHRWAKSWDGFLEAIGRPGLLRYTYLIDEPNDEEAYELTRAWGRCIREAGSGLKVLVTEQTRTQDPAWGDLHGAVDIWVPLFSLHDEETAAARRALGEEVWTYTALCQGEPTPWWHIDWPLLDYRIPAWIAFSHHMKGLLYWGGLSYWKNVEDPWTDPRTYTPGRDLEKGKEGLVYNGEGTLVYPGYAVGLAGPVPSMRLKALRDGIEDFEYLSLLEANGRREGAEAMVRFVAQGWNDWSRDPERWAQTRRKLGCLVNEALAASGKTAPEGPKPPTCQVK